jgi:enoyl-CoA hydratase/carnithine racemase
MPARHPIRDPTGSRCAGIREHPAIFVAAVNGFALGGGATLISMCDLAIAADQAEIGMPEIGFGAYPQYSGPAAQIQLTAKRAAWLVLTAECIDGRTGGGVGDGQPFGRAGPAHG